MIFIKKYLPLLLLFLYGKSFAQQIEIDNNCKSFRKEYFAENLSTNFKKNIGTHTDSNYDLVYEKLTFNINPNVWQIHGIINFNFKPTTTNFTSLTFDCYDSLIIDSVIYHSKQINFQQQSGDKLLIEFFKILPKNQLDSVGIIYHGKPNGSVGFGSFEQKTHNGSGIIWTLSEPYGASDWMPCKQSLNDKIDSIDIYIIAPDSFKSVSNGVRKSIIAMGNQTNITHWQHRYPIATYLIAIACTNYSEYSDWDTDGADSLQIQNFVYPENDSVAKSQTKSIVPIMKFYENKIGLYPFRKEKYGHAQFGRGGGMEHQTQTFVSNFNFRLLAHELAHQWFGDKSTCESWSEIWLNEGFATYFAALACENAGRNNDWSDWFWVSWAAITKSNAGSVLCDDTTSVNRIFDNTYSYYKGSWLLHMLHVQMGDTLFYKSIHEYIDDTRIKYNFTSTKILQSHFENNLGKSLDTFFRIWYSGKNIPNYKIKWWQNADSVKVHVEFLSNQSENLFWQNKLHFKFITWQNYYEQDSFFEVTNTANAQDFIFRYPYHLDEMQLDIYKTAVLANIELYKSPEAGYNFNAPIQITPNPASNEIFINQKKYGVIEINFIYMTGIISKKYLQNTSIANDNIYGDLEKIDISNLPPNFYIVEMKTKSGLIYYQKLIKQ